MLVRLKRDDPRFQIKAGDVFFAERYRFDPDKITLLNRVTDNYQPMCNQYKSDLEFLVQKQPTEAK